MRNRFNLTSKDFNKLKAQEKRLRPRGCSCGSNSVSVRVYYAFYGPAGVRCECAECGRAGVLQNITEAVGTEISFGTPVTYRSLIKGVKKAVADWNELICNNKKKGILNEQKFYNV